MFDEKYFNQLCAKKVLGYQLTPNEEVDYLKYSSGNKNPFGDDACGRDFGIVGSVMALQDLKKSAFEGDRAAVSIEGSVFHFVFVRGSWCGTGEIDEGEREVVEECERADTACEEALFADKVKFRAVAVDGDKVVFGYLSKRRNTEEKPSVLRYCIDQEEGGVMVSYIVKPETITQFVCKDSMGHDVYLQDEVVRRADGKTFVVDMTECGSIKVVSLGFEVALDIEQLGPFDVSKKFFA